MSLATIEQGLGEIRAGRMLIVVDDENRENEGDLLVAADKATPDAINFMSRYGRGLICVGMLEKRLQQLGIPMMIPPENNNSRYETPFTVSVDGAEQHGVTTGISAYDRAATIALLTTPSTTVDDLVMPGHVFPLRARKGGVLVRGGHTEASVDLTRLAGLTEAGVICEILAENGTMARLPQLEIFAKQHGLLIISIADLIEYRRRFDKLVRRVVDSHMPTAYGDFTIVAYEDIITREHHVALVLGQPEREKAPLVRVHSECLTGDVLGSLRCDCGFQLRWALEQISQVGSGVILYMRQEGRGIGLFNKLRAYALQDQGRDTVEANLELGFPADMRDYCTAAQILKDMGINSVRLITNNPKKIEGMDRYGIKISERISSPASVTEDNQHYLQTKQQKMGHLLDL